MASKDIEDLAIQADASDLTAGPDDLDMWLFRILESHPAKSPLCADEENVKWDEAIEVAVDQAQEVLDPVVVEPLRDLDSSNDVIFEITR